MVEMGRMEYGRMMAVEKSGRREMSMNENDEMGGTTKGSKE